MSTEINPIKVGLCAYGMSGRVFHAPFLHHLREFKLEAVVERHQKRAIQSYPSVRSHDSMEELFEEDDLELIVVNTPNVTHYDFVKKALEAHKHVVVEKPFTATVNQAEELIELSKKVNKSLTVFQNRRWDSDFLSVQEVLKQKKLGELIEAEFRYDRYRMGLSRKQHKEKRQKGVGLLYDLGPHLIDQAIVLFGKPQGLFARVQTHRQESSVDDYFHIQLLYENFNCTLKSSLLVREPLPAYTVHGSLGSFIKKRSDVQEEELDKQVSLSREDWGKEPDSEGGILHLQNGDKTVYQRLRSPQGDYGQFYRQLYTCIRESAPSPVALKDAVWVMQIIEAAQKSQWEKAVIELG